MFFNKFSLILEIISDVNDMKCWKIMQWWFILKTKLILVLSPIKVCFILHFMFDSYLCVVNYTIDLQFYVYIYIYIVHLFGETIVISILLLGSYL